MGKSSSSSSTPTTTTNEQAAAQTGTGSAVVVGAGSKTGAINIVEGGDAVALAALQYSQNESVIDTEEINENTALAFSTINNLQAANTSGQLAAAAQALTTSAAAVAGAASNVGAVQPTVIYSGGTSGTDQAGAVGSTSGTGTNGMSTGAWIAIAAVAAVGLYLVTRK
jgi:hypothetical protein